MASIPPDSHRITRLGPWVIQRVLGEGGMGIVYDAHDPTTGQRVALKALHGALSRNDVARRRFEAEMRILDGLVHPNIVRSLGSGVLDGRVVIVLEYLEGQTLRELLRAVGPLPPVRAAAIGEQIALALVSAHLRAKPIVHRDLKPENIMVLPDGAVKVMDFGVAKVLREIDAMTMGTKQVGTVRYMAPEQSDGRGISGKTDCYGLGLLLYEMLTGRPPFDGTTLVGILRQHCEVPPPPFDASLKARTPRELEDLVFALLAKRAEDRPDAATANAALRRIASAPQFSNPPVLAASATAPSPGRAHGAVTPRSVVSEQPLTVTPARREAQPLEGGQPPPLDTIGLIDRNTSKPRRRWPWIASAIALLIVAAAVTLAIVLSSGSSGPGTKSSSRSTAASAPPPGASGASSCKSLRCVSLDVPDPAACEASLLADKAVALAREIDPSMALANLTFSSNIRNGKIDTTRELGVASFLFVGRDGVVSILARQGQLWANAAMGTAAAPLGPACSFERAYDVARAADFPFDLSTSAILAGGKSTTEWIFLTNATALYVRGPECRIARP